MKYLVIVALLLIAASAQKTDIDVVLQLLKDLKTNAASELDLLNKQITESKQAKEAFINSLYTSAQSQRGQCNVWDQNVLNKERDIRITLSFINWLEKRIKENQERIARLELNRCESNSNFINDVKNSKKILNMIKFLRKAITNAKESDLPALLQSTQFKKLEKFATVLLQKKSYLAEGEDPLPDSEPENIELEVEAGDDLSEVDGDSQELLAAEPQAAEEIEEQAPPTHHESEAEDSVGGPIEAPNEAEGEELIVGPGGIAPQEEPEELAVEPDLESEPEAPVSANPLEDAEKQENADLEKQAAAFNKIIAKGQASSSDASVPPVAGKDYSQYSEAQQELLRFLDELEGEVSGTFSKVQDNQVKSAMGFNDFKGLIFKENDAFKGHLVDEDENLIKLQNQLITILQATAACKARLKQITTSIDLASEDLASTLAHYQTVKERLEGDLTTFDDVYRIYSNQVGSQSSAYKQDVQSRIK